MKIIISIWIALLFCTTVQAASILLQWDRNAPADKVTSYRVYDGARPFVNTTANSITLQNISTGRRYVFTVTARNATAESGPSNAVELLIPKAPTNSRMIVKGGLEIQ